MPICVDTMVSMWCLFLVVWLFYIINTKILSQNKGWYIDFGYCSPALIKEEVPSIVIHLSKKVIGSETIESILCAVSRTILIKGCTLVHWYTSKLIYLMTAYRRTWNIKHIGQNTLGHFLLVLLNSYIFPWTVGPLIVQNQWVNLN